MPSGEFDFGQAFSAIAGQADEAGQATASAFEGAARDTGSAIDDASKATASIAGDAVAEGQAAANDAGSAIDNAISATAQHAGEVTDAILRDINDGVAAALKDTELIVKDMAVTTKFGVLHVTDDLIDAARQASEKIRAFYEDNQDVIQAVLIGLGIALILAPVGVLVLNALGWQAGGVAAGSAAAVLQSVIYGANTGGMFAILQSIGATAAVNVPALIAGLGALGTAIGFDIASKDQAAGLLDENGTGVLRLTE